MNKDISSIELTIARFMKAGVLLSAALIALGLVLYIVLGSGGYPDGSYPTALSAIGQGLLRLKPYAVILTGLLLLILTPIFRVAIALLSFIKEKDRVYAIITTFVLAVLIVGLIMGKSA